MKKQLIIGAALAVLGASAFAQSTVTIYGKIDLGLRQAVGSNNKEVATGSDGRLGFRGSEDLGDGLSAFFDLQHRFVPSNGNIDGTQFWKGISVVGLQGSFGKVALGRQYIAAFSLVQDQIDPFGADTVAGVRDIGMRVGGITKVRVDNSIRYDLAMNGFKLAVSTAEAAPNGGTDRPLSLAANWKSGPLFLAAGMENPAGSEDRQWNVGAAYDIGTSTLSAGYAKGRTNAGVDAKGYVLGLNVPIGQGAIKAAYGTQQVAGTTTASKIGLGYHHALSKRTTIYTDIGNDSKRTSDKTGYDIGIKHLF